MPSKVCSVKAFRKSEICRRPSLLYMTQTQAGNAAKHFFPLFLSLFQQQPVCRVCAHKTIFGVRVCVLIFVEKLHRYDQLAVFSYTTHFITSYLGIQSGCRIRIYIYWESNKWSAFFLSPCLFQRAHEAASSSGRAFLYYPSVCTGEGVQKQPASFSLSTKMAPEMARHMAWMNETIEIACQNFSFSGFFMYWRHWLGNFGHVFSSIYFSILLLRNLCHVLTFFFFF